jgi:hypothetical protein
MPSIRTCLASLATIAALAAVSLLLAACGSSSSGSVASGASSSKSTTPAKSAPAHSTKSPAAEQKLIARADAICRKLNFEIATTPARSGSRKELLHVVPKNEASEREALAELSELTPTAKIASSWRQMLAVRRAAVTELTALIRAAKDNDRQASNALIVSKKRLHAKLKEVAKRAGLMDCASLG